MALRGDISQLRDLRRRVADMPLSVAHDVATRAAPEMTGLTRHAFDSGQTVYGEARLASKEDGRALTLRKTGATARDLGFTSIGTVVKCVLGPRYAKFLIGKYGILPNGGLPAAWSAKLRDLVASFRPS